MFLLYLVQFKLGKVYDRMAFYYSEWATQGGSQLMSKKDAREESLKFIDQALNMFTEVRN